MILPQHVGNVERLAWLANIAMEPVATPMIEGRWSQGLDFDQPEE